MKTNTKHLIVNWILMISAAVLGTIAAALSSTL